MLKKIIAGVVIFVIVVLGFELLDMVSANWERSQTAIFGWSMLAALLLAACAFVPIIVMKWNWREVFPIKKPKIRQIFGMVIFYIVSSFSLILVSVVLEYFFPEGMRAYYEASAAIAKELPFILSIFTLAVMPAFFEEILFRGTLGHAFRNDKHKWLSIIIISILFAVFHVNPFQIVRVFLIGVIITYIYVETRNIVLPIIYHFINNLVATILDFTNSTEEITEVAEIAVASLGEIGFWLAFASCVPLLCVVGRKLIKEKFEKTSCKMWIVATILCIIMLFTGIVIDGIYYGWLL